MYTDTTVLRCYGVVVLRYNGITLLRYRFYDMTRYDVITVLRCRYDHLRMFVRHLCCSNSLQSGCEHFGHTPAYHMRLHLPFLHVCAWQPTVLDFSRDILGLGVCLGHDYDDICACIKHSANELPGHPATKPDQRTSSAQATALLCEQPDDANRAGGPASYH